VSAGIVITGTGCVFPSAVGIGALELALFGGGSGSRRVEDLAEASKRKLPPLVRRRMSRLASMVSLACVESLGAAGIRLEEERDRIGLVFGTGYGELDTTSRMFLAGLEDHMSPTLFHNSVHNAPMGYAGIITGIRGPSLTVSDGHVSGESAFIRAAGLVVGGVASIVAAGAGDERYEFPLFKDPGQRTDPGEGSGFAVIESLESAARRGTRPICEMRGWSAGAFDGDPDDVGARVDCACTAFEGALSGAGESARSGLALFAHLWGGGTDDEVLLSAASRVFGGEVTTWSSRDFCGAFPASGSARMLAAALSLARDELPAGVRIAPGSGGRVESVLVVGMDPEGDVSAVLLSPPEGGPRR
jgi:3-oxoacyl-(acyl-carrier-protein) synthase